MALPFTTIESAIMPKYLGMMGNAIFRNDYYLWNQLWKNKKTFNGNQFQVGVEYNNLADVQDQTATSTVAYKIEEFMSKAYDEQYLKSASITISFKEHATMNSPEAVENIMTRKMKNVQRGFTQKMAGGLWKRVAKAASSATETLNRGTYDWNNIYDIMGDTLYASKLHNITPSDLATLGSATYWEPQLIDCSTTFPGCQTRDGLIGDTSASSFVERIFDQMIAYAKPFADSMSDLLIVCGQSVFDGYAAALGDKRRYMQDAKAADEGFDVLRKNGVRIVADPYICYGQTSANSNTDGWIECINMAHLNLCVNSNAAFSSTDFVRPHNANYRVALINLMGQIYTTNRRAHVHAYNVWTDRAYSGTLTQPS
jgi:hypothetical protein